MLVQRIWQSVNKNSNKKIFYYFLENFHIDLQFCRVEPCRSMSVNFGCFDELHLLPQKLWAWNVSARDSAFGRKWKAVSGNHQWTPSLFDENFQWWLYTKWCVNRLSSMKYFQLNTNSNHYSIISYLRTQIIIGKRIL